ncbi:hypothetical protein EON78_00090 [bacterium]|nr:MAG: hypothetical protein EON78_00090 [bacterium]
MAAPLTVYSTNKLPISGSTTTTLPLALNLGTYTNIKEHFYLDKVFRVEEDFIGMVKVGGANYSYHNPNRFSKLRAKDESNGEVYIICNDGGLNTLGYSTTPTIATAEVGNIQVSSMFKTQYYDGFSSHGWEVLNTRNGLTGTFENGVMNERTIATKSYTGWLVSIGAAAGDTLQVRSYGISPEGIYSSSYQSVVLQARVLNFGYDTYASVAKTKYDYGTYTVIYLDAAFLTNSNLYKDSAMTINADSGYISDGTYWYKVEIVSGKAKITATGEASAGNYPIGDPSYITPFNWRGYDPSTSLNYGQSCAVATNTRTTFRDNLTNIHYKDSAMTTLADNGTYTIMTAPTTWYWHKIINGVSTSTGICGS